MNPDLDRPFRAPLYPTSQGLALMIAVISLFSMFYFNPRPGLIYLALLITGSVWFHSRIPIKTDKEAS
jgi:ethanolamine permease